MESLGPPLWQSMHGLAFTAPDKLSLSQRYWFRQFYESLAHILPCDICRQDYAALFYHDVPYADDDIAAWTVRAHNSVNKRLGKRQIFLEEARHMYTTQKTKDRSYLWKGLLFVMLAGLVTVFFLHTTNKPAIFQ